MVGEQTFRHCADCAARLYAVADLYGWREFPVAVRDRIEVHASFQEETALLCKLRQRVLQTVKYLGQQSRTQIYGHELAGELYRVADLDAVCHLVDLHAYLPVVDTYDLSLEAFISNEDVTNFILSNGAIEINFD